MFSKFLKFLQAPVFGISLDNAWPNPAKNGISQSPSPALGETTLELLALFGRRRELMYQIAALIVVGSAMLKASSNPDLPRHFNIQLETWLSLFMAISSLLFCFRFIQLHLGILYHGVYFAGQEYRVINPDGPPLNDCHLAPSRALNWFGISFSVILFFSSLFSLCAVVSLFTLFQINPYFLIFLFFLFLGSPVFLGRFFHIQCANYANQRCLDNQYSPKSEDKSKLIEHYRLSMAGTHSDMICFTAVSALQTFATIEIISWYDEKISLQQPVSNSGPFLFSFISFILGFLAFNVYSRSELALIRFSDYLYGTDNPLGFRIINWWFGDTIIGYLVTAFFCCFNLFVFIFFFSKWAGWPEWLGGVTGCAVFFFLILRRLSFRSTFP